MPNLGYKIALGWLLLLCGCATLNSIPSSPIATATPSPTLTPTPTTQVALVMERVITPSPTLTPTATATTAPMPIPTPATPLYSYHTLAMGETLTYIAYRYNTSIEEIVAMNSLDGPDALLQEGQALRVPLSVTRTLTTTHLLPDSEVVYSPAYTSFNVAEFITEQGGYLQYYYEQVDGTELTGPEVVTLVAERFSVGPRVLLALLEHHSQWVTDPSVRDWQYRRPMGPKNPHGRLYLAMAHTANIINQAYYGYKRDGFWVFRLADRSRAVTPVGLNAGTVAIQNALATHAEQDTWQADTDNFMNTYALLFGDPISYTIDVLVPSNLTQPALVLPWKKGEGFYFTSGPHPGYIDGSAWAAIDFGPPDVLGSCFYSNVPNTAVAPGQIVTAKQGEVQLDLDSDGYIQTGWVLLYLHVALDVDTPVQMGQHVDVGDVIGYASCEGGLSNASHLHLARRYNGEWLDAGGSVPMVLSGWEVQPSSLPYEGVLQNGSETRESCECWDATLNLITH